MRSIVAALAILFLLTPPAVASDQSEVQRAIATLLREWIGGRSDAVYELMSNGAKKAVGRAQLAAYLKSRNAVLGKLRSFDPAHVSSAVEEEHGMTIYQSLLHFEKGTAPAWFYVTHEDGQWRVLKFGVEVKDAPKGDAAEVLTIANEMMQLVKSAGTGAIADRVSKEALAETNITLEEARASLTEVGAAIGPLKSYHLGEPEELQNDCMKVEGDAAFELTTASLRVDLCWSDGVWALHHLDVTPRVNGAVLARMFENKLPGKLKVRCPADVEVPIDQEITCRFDVAGEKSQNARIKRTGETGFKVVGLTPIE